MSKAIAQLFAVESLSCNYGTDARKWHGLLARILEVARIELRVTKTSDTPVIQPTGNVDLAWVTE